MTTELQQLGGRLVGDWTTEATHPMVPGTVITGRGRFEWLDGEEFLIFRFHYDHPEFPDAISILGDTDGLRMHYFDARGVHRLFELTVTDDGWTVVMDRDSPAGSFTSDGEHFAQRMTYTFDHQDQTMSGKGQLSHDDLHWEDDLEITYRRTS